VSFQSLLNTVVTVKRKSPSKDRSGGQVENFQPVPGLEDLPANIQPHHGRPVMAQAQRQVVITHMVYLQDGSEIRRGDLLFEAATGRSFLTHGAEDMAGRHEAWRVGCTEVT
jgi:hypothetical protein